MPARADRDNDNGNGLKKGHDKHDPPPIGAPEIDPGSMLGGVTLLAGGALILADRCRRRTPQLGAD